jgi:hypothetical protein
VLWAAVLTVLVNGEVKAETTSPFPSGDFRVSIGAGPRTANEFGTVDYSNDRTGSWGVAGEVSWLRANTSSRTRMGTGLRLDLANGELRPEAFLLAPFLVGVGTAHLLPARHELDVLFGVGPTAGRTDFFTGIGLGAELSVQWFIPLSETVDLQAGMTLRFCLIWSLVGGGDAYSEGYAFQPTLPLRLGLRWR